MAAYRSPPRLRIRRQHGRTRDVAARRAPPAPACRRGRVRRADEHGGAYRAFVGQPLGASLQTLARREIGGTPTKDPHGYALRSPLDWARTIAYSGVPLQIWWSTRDRIVTDQRDESGLLYRMIKRLDPSASATEFVGDWAHTTEMKWYGYLPYALSRFGLMPPREEPPALASMGERPV